MATPPTPIQVDGKVAQVARLADGRLITFFCDQKRFDDLDSEQAPMPVYMRVSHDAGNTWGDARTVAHYPGGKGIVSGAPLVLVDDQDRIHLFNLRFFAIGWESGNWHSVLQHMMSHNDGESWSDVQTIDFGAGYSGALNSGLQMDNGRILIPLSYFAPERTDGQLVSRVVYSDDGEQWAYSNDCTVEEGGAFFESGAVEPVVVQFPSGMLWMLIRTVTGYFWESFSNDGAIWTPARPTRIVSSNAPGGLVRLDDGRIVLCWNNLYGEPMRENGVSYARQVLSAAISDDEAQTWSAPKAIAQRNPGEPMRAQTTYPFPCQAADGSVLVLYHRVYAREGQDWYNPTRELVRLEPDWLMDR